MYNDIVMEHFANPRNTGSIPDADAVGSVGSPVCGDLIRIFVKIKHDLIEDIKFQAFGCGAAIATSSMTTEMVKGKPFDEARRLTGDQVAEALGGLPPGKMYCSNLAAEALHNALDDYRHNIKPQSKGPATDR